MNGTDMHIDPEALALAAEALCAAARRDNDDIERILTHLIAEHGPEGMTGAMGVWCDTLIVHTGGYKPGALMRLEFGPDNDGDIRNADQVHAATAWAGRLITARRILDRDQWLALLAAMPDDADIRGDYLVTLLSCVAETLRETTNVQAANTVRDPGHPSHDGLRRNAHWN